MSAEENKQFVTDALAALNAGDAEKFLDALADDMRFTLIGSTSYSVTYEGKQAFVSQVLEKLVGELDGGIELRPQNIVAEGDHVVVEAQGKAPTKSGQDYNNTYCFVYRLAGGRSSRPTSTWIRSSSPACSGEAASAAPSRRRWLRRRRRSSLK